MLYNELKNKGIKSFKEGNFSSAINFFEKAISKVINKSEKIELFVWIARLFCDSTNYQKANEYIAKALHIDQNNEDAWLILALMAKKLNKKDILDSSYKKLQIINNSLSRPKIEDLIQPNKTALSLSKISFDDKNVEKINVVLIQPAEPFPSIYEVPLSIIGLASILQESKISVEILDARAKNLTVFKTLDYLKGKKIDVVGITGLNNAYRYIKDFSFEFKRKYPEIPLIAGGAFIMTQPDLILRNTPIDVACTGSGENIIVDLVTRLAKKKDISDINNIAYLREGTLFRTAIKHVADLDRFPFPAYDLIDMSLYSQISHIKHWNYNFFPISVGRGCTHHCYYCGRNFSKIVRVSPQRVVEHMDFLHQNYGIRAFLFSEDNAFHQREWMIEICKILINKKEKYFIDAPPCPHHLDDEVVKLASEANFVQMGISVEHWNPNIQKGFFRVKHSKSIEPAMHMIQKNKIHNNGFNILWGHPKDTAKSFRENYLKSIEITKKYDIPHFWSTALVIYPNSKLQKDVLKREKIINYEDYMYASTGYGPYVNITSEDDDVYRAVIIEQKYMEELDYSIEKLKFVIFQHLELTHNEYDQLFKQIQGYVNHLILLKKLLSLPLPEREKHREILEQLLYVQMYSPKKNYYHEIACFKELMSLEQGSQISVFSTESFSGENQYRLFNSIREKKLNLKSFIDITPSINSFEGYRVVSLKNIHQVKTDYIVVPEIYCDMINDTFAQTDIKIIKISNNSFALNRWGLGGLNCGYYNYDFWNIFFNHETKTLERKMIPKYKPEFQ